MNAEKRLTIFQLRRAPTPYNKFDLGNKHKSKKKGGGWGKNLHFKIKIHPCLSFEEKDLKVAKYLKVIFSRIFSLEEDGCLPEPSAGVAETAVVASATDTLQDHSENQ